MNPILYSVTAMAGRATGTVWRLVRAPRIPTTSQPTTVPIHRRLGRLAAAVLGAWLAVVLARSEGLGVWLLAAVSVWVVLAGPTRLQRARYTRDAYQRTRKITKDEEYAADHAQNRRHRLSWLQGDWRQAHLQAFWEPMRRPVHPARVVRITFTRQAPWWPRRRHIAAITRRWAREWEPASSVNGLDKLRAQLESFMDGRALEAKVSYKHCRATFTPAKATPAQTEADAATLPDRLTYPSPGEQVREAS